MYRRLSNHSCKYFHCCRNVCWASFHLLDFERDLLVAGKRFFALLNANCQVIKGLDCSEDICVGFFQSSFSACICKQNQIAGDLGVFLNHQFKDIFGGFADEHFPHIRGIVVLKLVEVWLGNNDVTADLRPLPQDVLQSVNELMSTIAYDYLGKALQHKYWT